MRQELAIEILEGECWWGGAVPDGVLMPYTIASFHRTLIGNLRGGQGMPLLISNKGRFIWSEEPFAFAFEHGQLRIDGTGRIDLGEGYCDLPNVFRHVSQEYFPSTGSFPDPLLFTAPQYNTWIEMRYEPTQARVLTYAAEILAHDLPPGVLMIDDNWQEDYGVWRFHPERFPDPKAMVDQLHAMGFKVMLWTSPFVSPDCVTFRMLEQHGYCLRTDDGSLAIRRWWNGYSAILDGSNDHAVAWYHEQLDRLVEQYGIDGFKFDAGDPEYYQASDITYQPSNPNDQCERWGRVGLRYTDNEYRACWKLAGQPLAQRLRDKHHVWSNTGLAALIPEGLALGLMGYPYSCPDMIGGGDIASFVDPHFCLDQELFVRYAQCSALFPMMQFSAAPWRVLDQEHLAYCLAAAHLHMHLQEDIVTWARHAAVTGEPILRHMAYVFPDQGYEHVDDQFMLGDSILVAPVLAQGATCRKVRFPPGTWRGSDGTSINGPTIKEVAAPLSTLPWYRRSFS